MTYKSVRHINRLLSRLAKSKSTRVGDALEIVKPKADNEDGNRQGDQKVNDTRAPLRDCPNLARAFFLIILVQAFQCVLELAADFSGRVLAGEQFRKAMRIRR